MKNPSKHLLNVPVGIRLHIDFFVFQYNAPLVFLPVHKSHIDYLLITFILFCHNIKAPHIAAGNNLNIPIFRWGTCFLITYIHVTVQYWNIPLCWCYLFPVCFSFSTLIRKLGGFFIRRKMDETPDGKKDVLYRALLHAVTRQRHFACYCYFSFLLVLWVDEKSLSLDENP